MRALGSSVAPKRFVTTRYAYSASPVIWRCSVDIIIIARRTLSTGCPLERERSHVREQRCKSRMNIDWQALRLAWGEWTQRPVKVRSARQWTRSENGRLFGVPVGDEPVFTRGLFTTSASTDPPSSPDTLIPNVRAWLSTEPPPLPFGMDTGVGFWLGAEPPPPPPSLPWQPRHVDDYDSAGFTCTAFSKASPGRSSCRSPANCSNAARTRTPLRGSMQS